ncbi:MAG: hypothetical protein K2K09_02160 [Lachnospiraceae bacterium]|nr:hypothetical protein [Lachnospiraceae bacterium]
MDANMEEDKTTEMLFKILDAETMKEKLELMNLYREKLDGKTLGNIAASYDIVAGYKNDDELFEQIEQYFMLRSRYETDRLR